MSLLVQLPGVQSLLVDFGRPRARGLGMPVGGAADRAALALGNALVGNDPDAVGLEIALAGPTLEALHPTACVLFGAPFDSAVNGTPFATGITWTLEPGDILRIGGTPFGTRAYLCVAGGFDAPNVLGSRSALHPLRGGETLVCPSSRTERRRLPFTMVVDTDGVDQPPGSPTVLRALDGPQHEWFAGDAFWRQEYEVSAASNRMGLRLKGTPLSRRPDELVSEAVAPGAVQVTNDGQPVVLGIDGQTIGGYPKVAHVIRADLDRLGQLRPGDRVRFVRVSLAEARQAAQARASFLHQWLDRLRVAERHPVIG